MPKQLFESDFLTVNLGSMLKNQKSNEQNVETNYEDSHEQNRDLRKISDWGKELKDRLDANNTLTGNLRKSNYDVEQEFFKDYFSSNSWDSASAENLMRFGMPLQKAIKILGFDAAKNPILGFLTNDFVIKNLLQTKLLNVNTFKAIYNAVAKNLVADSEFFATNDYNILYCQDLYRHTAKEIEEYLIIQKDTLKISVDAYSTTDMNINKKVFFYLEDITEVDLEKRKNIIKSLPENNSLPKATDTATKLNDIELARLLSRSINDKQVKSSDINLSNNANTLAKSLNNKAQFFVALQQLSTATSVPELGATLKSEIFKSLSVDDIAKATIEVVPLVNKYDLSDNAIKSFISLMYNKLELE